MFYKDLAINITMILIHFYLDNGFAIPHCLAPRVSVMLLNIKAMMYTFPKFANITIWPFTF